MEYMRKDCKGIIIYLSLLFQLQVLPIKPEGGDSVLCGVVGHPLDPSVQEVPSQELQRHPPLLPD